MKQTVYVASPKNQQIHAWSLNREGTLTLTQVVDVPGQIQLMVVSLGKRCLYVGARPKFRVLAYRITPSDNALTFAAESTLSGNPTHISTDHQGQFVFVGSYNMGNVSITRLEDGLPMGAVDVVKELDDYHPANASPDNRTLWAPALKQDRTCLFAVSDGDHPVVQNPAEIATVEEAGPHHMVFHPGGQYVYYVDELNSSMGVWELKGPHDNIECVRALDMMLEDSSDTRWAADIRITPDSRHLYAYDRTASLTIIFDISEDGNMLSKGGFRLTETQPRGSNVGHSDKHPIAAGRGSHHISTYKIASEEGLLHEKDHYAVGQGPIWVVVNAY